MPDLRPPPGHGRLAVPGEPAVTPRRVAAGRACALAGALITLGSMFLPWYTLRLRISSYADLSAFAIVHIGGARLNCDPPAGGGCHLSAQVGVLATGLWNWRALIAAGAAGIAACVLLRVLRAGPDSPRAWRALTVFAAATTVLVLAALLTGPIGPTAPPGMPSLGLDLASSPAYGAFLALAGALAALAGAVLARRRPPG